MSMLGCKVKEVLTGIEGVCTGITKYQFGCTHISVAPLTSDNTASTPKEEYWLEEYRVEPVLDENGAPIKVFNVDGFEDEFCVKLGEKVTDPNSGFTGICTSCGIYASGNRRITITSSKLDRDGKRIHDHFDEKLFEKAPTSADENHQSTPRRGGPERSTPKFRDR